MKKFLLFFTFFIVISASLVYGQSSNPCSAPRNFLSNLFFKSKPKTENPKGLLIREGVQIPINMISTEYCYSEEDLAEEVAQEDFDKKKTEMEKWCKDQGGDLIYTKGSKIPTYLRRAKTFKAYRWGGTDPSVNMEKRYCVEIRQTALCVISKIIQT